MFATKVLKPCRALSLTSVMATWCVSDLVAPLDCETEPRSWKTRIVAQDMELVANICTCCFGAGWCVILGTSLWAASSEPLHRLLRVEAISSPGPPSAAQW